MEVGAEEIFTAGARLGHAHALVRVGIGTLYHASRRACAHGAQTQRCSDAEACYQLRPQPHAIAQKTGAALDLHRRILASAVPSHSPTTEELLKRAEEMMRQDWAYLENLNAALDQLQKTQEKFEAEHPPFGSRYS